METKTGFDWGAATPAIIALLVALPGLVAGLIASINAKYAKEMARTNAVNIREQSKQVQANAVAVAKVETAVGTLTTVEKLKQDLLATLLRNPNFDGNPALITALEKSIPDPDETK